MKKNITSLSAIFLVLVLILQTSLAESVGRVDFQISCDKQAQQQFNHAMALTHNMMYVQAGQEFVKITKQNPGCAMAYWGIALVQIHPLWSDIPTSDAYENGEQALLKAKSFKNISEKEKAFINAISPLYKNRNTISYKKRIELWEQAQYKLYKKYPNDPEAISLYALAHLAVAPKDDKELKNQDEAGKLLEKMHAKNPSHPAGYHYTIHAYDNPKFAKKGEKYAAGYDKIAPEVPHALHMPSHIFVRLGQWQRTINWNIRSAAAAKKHYLKGGVMPMHYVHALDYLMYAYLQQAEDKKAAKVLEQLNSVEKYQPTFPASYGIAAARARFYLEQHLWKQSAQIPLEMPKDFPWQKFPMAQSITYFAWGMGAIREGNLSQGKEAIEQLDKFYKQLENSKQNYWATLVDSKKQSLLAWLQLEEGDKKTALKLMKRAAVLEDSVDKHPVTPGEVLPARELYGDMLMKVGQPKMALKAYQAVLKISPNRFNSLYGAASAAAQTGNQGLAKDYYGQLIKLTQKADTDRAEIKIAKTYLKMN